MILIRKIHRRATSRYRATAVAAIVVGLAGCASLSPGRAAAGDPAAAPAAAQASALEVRAVPVPVSDVEVSETQAALRSASQWGAQYYQSRLYARARLVFDEALASRTTDPARCRRLLAEATAASNEAREAALQAYEKDVKIRFETSRTKLVEIGADRAFPQEFSRLVSGVGATADLFAAGSYWDARIKAYYTLKGMSDLYETVRSRLGWLRDARIRVENAIDMALQLGASEWAPGEMTNAERLYHDALAQMQAGDLNAAIDSMRGAGEIAVRLQYLVPDHVDPRAASVPLARSPAIPE